jgi:hypothetical protein
VIGPFTFLEISVCGLTAALLMPSTGLLFFDMACGWGTWGLLLGGIFWIKNLRPRH